MFDKTLQLSMLTILRDCCYIKTYGESTAVHQLYGEICDLMDSAQRETRCENLGKMMRKIMMGKLWK